MKSRFHVFTNLAISMDGKITTRDRELFPLGSWKDHYFMDFHRARAHAVLMGAGTLRSFKNAVTVERSKFKSQRKRQGLTPNPINIVITSKPDFDVSWPFFKALNVQRVLAVPSTTPRRLTKKFESVASIFYFKNQSTFPKELINHLHKYFDCKNLLLEGGGGTIFPFAKQDLIDEWNITVTPKIVGGESAPTMVDGEGFLMKDIKTYRLKKLLRYKDELFLQYLKP